ncbi:MAG: hypothetical protein QOF43_435 [Gaiellaceae bacterium]|nr:hypothetical protein [Gaiellaceae bacterium]
MGFVCSVCGEFHDERMLDIRLGLPDAIHALTDEEREKRAWLSDDFAVLDDEHFYVRGLLDIPIPELEARFGYGIWAEVTQEEFLQLMGRWNDPVQPEPLEAVLANELSPYAGTAGLRVLFRPVSADRLPAVTLLDADHELVADQQRGISATRSDELAATVLH